MSGSEHSAAAANHSDEEETYLTQWGTLREAVADLDAADEGSADIRAAFKAIDDALKGKKLGKKIDTEAFMTLLQERAQVLETGSTLRFQLHQLIYQVYHIHPVGLSVKFAPNQVCENCEEAVVYDETFTCQPFESIVLCEDCYHSLEVTTCAECDELCAANQSDAVELTSFHCVECGHIVCRNCTEHYKCLTYGHSDPVCCACAFEDGNLECHVCCENIWARDRMRCSECDRDYCEDCENGFFQSVCDECEGNAFDEDDESIQLISRLQSQECDCVAKERNGLCECWICQESSAILNTSLCRMLVSDYNHCAVSFTMIQACECGPCHIRCLYALREDHQRGCPNCLTAWQPEIYYLMSDDQRFGLSASEKAKSDAIVASLEDKKRITLAEDKAEEILARHQRSVIARHDDKYKASYALVSLPRDVVVNVINPFLEQPPPPPSPARLLKEDYKLFKVKERFGEAELDGALRAIAWLEASFSLWDILPGYLPCTEWGALYVQRHIETHWKYTQGNAGCLKYKQGVRNELLKYNVEGILPELERLGKFGGKHDWSDIIRVIARFEKGNEGESKS